MGNKGLVFGLLAIMATAAVGEDFPQTCAAAAKAVPAGSIAFKGKDGWLYTGSELRHLAAGKFFAPAPQGANADPVPAIVDFNDQLKKLGVKLILVPVPPKATVHPEGLGSKASPDAAYANLREFYGLLKAMGVDVLDLHGSFDAAVKAGQEPYCRQDSHWSPAGCALAAKQIAGRVDCPGAAKRAYAAETKEQELAGDLWSSLGDQTLPKEKLKLSQVTGQTVDANSPVLVMGDSHCLVFHSGADMLAERAGLADQLALALGYPVDLLAVRGSGATPVRINLYRKAKKDAAWFGHIKVIVWCFTAREFTEASGGWKKVPVGVN